MSDVKFIDRRVDEDQDQGPSVEDQHSDEQDRQARRQGIRQQMAEHAVALEKAATLESECRESHQRVDLAADQHRAETDPIQAELEQLERVAISRIASRSPADATADQRRRALIGMIAAANAVLEETVAHEKRLRRPAEIQADRLRQEFVDPKALESRLAQPLNAHPELLVKSFVAQQCVKFAEYRRAEAVRGLRIIEANLQGIKTGQISRSELSAQERRLARWEAELAAAGDAITEALARSSAIGREIVNE